jgi:hypothetical protein
MAKTEKTAIAGNWIPDRLLKTKINLNVFKYPARTAQ